MLLSLILPVYNVEAYLGRCIESCLNQDLPKSEYEIIVVIDGSPDNSIDVAKRYQEKNKNIKIVTRENGGLSAARNTGLQVASGDYLWFIDSDDAITENSLKGIYEEMTHHSLEVLWLKWHNMNEFQERVPLYDCTLCKEDYSVRNGLDFMCSVMGIYYFAWSFVFKRDFLNQNGLLFKEGLFYEDTEFAYHALPLVKRIKLYHKDCYTYGIRQGSIAQTISSKKIDDLLSIVNTAKTMDAKYPGLICFRRSASNILVTVLNQSLAIGYKKGIKQVKDILKSFLHHDLYVVGSGPNRLLIKCYNHGGFALMKALSCGFCYIKKVRNYYRNVRLSAIRGGQKLTLVPSYLYDKILAYFYKSSMRHCGKNVYLRPSSSDFKGLWNLSVGDYTSIPKGSIFYCTEAPLIIGKKVIFGPRPTIITGDHRIDVVGKYIMDSNDKLPENDAAVVIEDDVWTGANVTILKGVTIGRGSVVAAGAVVTKSCPPYSIIGGVPAKVLKMRFTPAEIVEHEKLLR